MGETDTHKGAIVAQKELSHIERGVVDAYVEVGHVIGRAAKTAEKCGITKRGVEKIVARSHVSAAIHAREQEIRKVIESNQLLRREWIIHQLIEVQRQCMKGEPVMEFDPVDKCMVPTGEWMFDSKGANRALELLGKEIGMFEKKPTVDNRKIFNVQINLNKYHDEHGNLIEQITGESDGNATG